MVWGKRMLGGEHNLRNWVIVFFCSILFPLSFFFYCNCGNRGKKIYETNNAWHKIYQKGESLNEQRKNNNKDY